MREPDSRRRVEVRREHPDFVITDSLPGAGPALAPRLIAALGTRRDRYQSAGELLWERKNGNAGTRCGRIGIGGTEIDFVTLALVSVQVTSSGACYRSTPQAMSEVADGRHHPNHRIRVRQVFGQQQCGRLVDE